MTHLKKLSGAVAALGLMLATVAIPVSAQVTAGIQSGLQGAGKASGYTTGQTDLPTIVGRLINAALSLLGVILLAYILYGGFLWMTAGGEEKGVLAAKSYIKNAVIGLVIIVSAYAISTFVLGSLVNVTSSAASAVGTNGCTGVGC